LKISVWWAARTVAGAERAPVGGYCAMGINGLKLACPSRTLPMPR
jgi:hypothetical protein